MNSSFSEIEDFWYTYLGFDLIDNKKIIIYFNEFK